jgi:phosphatidylinositol glycan class K
VASIVGDLYENDFGHEDNYPQKILEVFSGRYDAEETGYRRVTLDENTNLFYYILGHGGDGYFKILDTTVVFAQNMADYLEDPAFKSKFRNLFFMSDSCGAGTLFHKIGKMKGTFWMGSSSWDQNSISLDYDEIFSQPLNDRFTHRFVTLMKEGLKPKGDPEFSRFSWGDVTKHMNHTYLEADLLEFNYMNQEPEKVPISCWSKIFLKDIHE